MSIIARKPRAKVPKTIIKKGIHELLLETRKLTTLGENSKKIGRKHG